MGDKDETALDKGNASNPENAWKLPGLDALASYKAEFEHKLASHISGENKKAEVKQDSEFDRAAKNDVATRRAVVLARGAQFGLDRLGKDFDDAFHGKLPETEVKALTACGITLGMRYLLPLVPGGQRLGMVAGALMGASFIRDLAQPLQKAWGDAAYAKSGKDLEKAARKLGKGESAMVVDSTIGIGAGFGTEKSLDLGTFAWTKLTYKPMPIPDRMAVVKKAWKDSVKEKDANRVYAHGFEGKGLGHSINELLQNTELDPAKAHIYENSESLLKRKGPKKGGDQGAENVENKAADAKTERATPAKPAYGTIEAQIMAEMTSQNIESRADVARQLQSQRSPWDLIWDDIKDKADSHFAEATDPNRRGPLLKPEYQKSTKELLELLNQVHTPQDYKEAFELIYYHEMASAQLPLNRPLVLDLNKFSEDQYNTFIERLDKAGISHKVLVPGLAPLNTIANDRGGGNFTITNLPGLTERAVIVLPRGQTELASVFSGISGGHEFGHNSMFGRIGDLPKDLRDGLLQNAIKEGMKGVKDEIIKVPTVDKDGNPATISMPKSEFLLNVLKAQANENTADMFGTAVSGSDTYETLVALLASLRDGGKLETRSIMGQYFAEDGNPLGIEGHGIDRFRVKLCAQVLRHLSGVDEATIDKIAQGDKDALKALSDGQRQSLALADAADKLADDMVEPGQTHYVWASADQRGKYVAIPMSEVDALIKPLVKLQFDYPLEALEGKTLRQAIVDDLPGYIQKIDGLGTKMVSAMQTGHQTVPDFDRESYRVGDVFRAGMVAWRRAVNRGHDAQEALKSINKISEDLRSQYFDRKVLDTPVSTLGHSAKQIGKDLWRLGKIAQVSPYDAVKYAGINLARTPGRAFRSAGAFASPMSNACAAHYLGQIVRDEEMRRKMNQDAGQ